jgi:glycosyltransferase involved in cell wall biosynthesis
VDTIRYHPLSNKEILKEKFNLKGRFVVGFVGKNQRRKMQAYLLRGFARFAKGKDDVTLLLHTDIESGAGWSLPCLIAKNESEFDPELEKPRPKIITTNQALDVVARQRISTEAMNEIYNLFDVFCYAVGGEGFGLPGIECQSAGIPLMMTDYSAAAEIVSDKELLIPVLKDIHGRNVTEIGCNGVENAIPDDVAVSELLEKVYKEFQEGKLKERGEKAREFAVNYDWEIIADKWIKFFEQEA